MPKGQTLSLTILSEIVKGFENTMSKQKDRRLLIYWSPPPNKVVYTPSLLGIAS